MSKKEQLIDAVEKSLVDEVAKLIGQKVNPNVTNKEGRPLLVIAATNNKPAIVSSLLSAKKVDPNIVNIKNGMTALYVACLYGYEQIVDLLLAVPGINVEIANNADGGIPLTVAAYGESLSIVKKLFGKGAALNAQMKDGSTALLMGVLGGSPEVVRFLLENGGYINTANEKGITPLHIVCENTNKEILTILLQGNPDLTKQNKEGENPFHVACRTGEMFTVELLVSNHRNIVHELTNLQDSALKIAYLSGKKEVVDLLINEGANLNQSNSQDEILLHHVCEKGDEQLFWQLIQAKVDINRIDKTGYSPLLKACQNQHWDIANLLLLNGADSNVLTNEKDGLTPLHMAIQADNMDFAKILYAYGSDLLLTSKKQINAKKLVKQKKNKELEVFFKKPPQRGTLLPDYKQKQQQLAERFEKNFFEAIVPQDLNELPTTSRNKKQASRHRSSSSQPRHNLNQESEKKSFVKMSSFLADGVIEEQNENKIKEENSSINRENAYSITQNNIIQEEEFEKPENQPADEIIEEPITESKTIILEKDSEKEIKTHSQLKVDSPNMQPTINLISESQSAAVQAIRLLVKGTKEADQAKIFQALQQLDQINYLEISDPMAIVNNLIKLMEQDIPYPWLQSKVIEFMRMYSYLVFIQYKERGLSIGRSSYERIKTVVENENERQIKKSKQLNWYRFELEMLRVVTDNFLDPNRREDAQEATKEALFHGILGLGIAFILAGKISVQTSLAIPEGIMSGLGSCGLSSIANTGKSPMKGLDDLKPLLNQSVAIGKIIGVLSKELARTAKSFWYIDAMILFNFAPLAVRSEDLFEDFYQLIDEQKNPNWHLLYANVESLYKVICAAEKRESDLFDELNSLQEDDERAEALRQQIDFCQEVLEKVFFGEGKTRPGLVDYLTFGEKSVVEDNPDGGLLLKLRRIVKESNDWRIREVAARRCIELYEHSKSDISQTAMELIVDRRVHESDSRVLTTLNDPLSIVKVKRAMKMDWNTEEQNSEKTLEEWANQINTKNIQIWQASRSMITKELSEQKAVLETLHTKIEETFGPEKIKFQRFLREQEAYQRQLDERISEVSQQLGIVLEVVEKIKEDTTAIRVEVSEIHQETVTIQQTTSTILGKTNDIQELIASGQGARTIKWADFDDFERTVFTALKESLLLPEELLDIAYFLSKKGLLAKVDENSTILNTFMRYFQRSLLSFYDKLATYNNEYNDLDAEYNRICAKIRSSQGDLEGHRQGTIEHLVQGNSFHSIIKSAQTTVDKKVLKGLKKELNIVEPKRKQFDEKIKELFDVFILFLANFHKISQIFALQGINGYDNYEGEQSLLEYFNDLIQKTPLTFSDHFSQYSEKAINLVEKMRSELNGSPVYTILKKSKKEMFKRLMTVNPSLLTFDHPQYGKAYLFAFKYAKVEILDELINYISLTELKKESKMIFHFAAHNNRAVLEWVNEKVSSVKPYINSLDANDRTVLDLAILHQEWESALFLLNQGGQSGGVRSIGHAIVGRCIQHEQFGLLLAILNRNLKVLPKTSSAIRALIVAQCEDELLTKIKSQIIEKLMMAGASVNDTYDDKSLIFWAVEYGLPSIVKMLIHNGGDVNLLAGKAAGKELKKMTAIHLAIRKGDVQSVNYLLNSESVDLSLKTKQKFGEGTSPKGTSIAHWAAACNNETIKKLIEERLVEGKVPKTPKTPKTPRESSKTKKQATTSTLFEEIRLNETSKVRLNTKISKEEVTTLCKNLSCNKSLLCLVLDACGLDDDDLENIVHAIIPHKNLCVLILLNNDFSPERANNELKRLITFNTSLFYMIILSKNKNFKLKNCDGLLETIYSHSSPKFMGLQLNDLTGPAFQSDPRIVQRIHRARDLFNRIINNQQIIIEDLLNEGFFPILPIEILLYIENFGGDNIRKHPTDAFSVTRIISDSILGNTPLYFAVNSCGAGMVELLLKYYYLYDQRDISGKTLIELAQKKGDQATVELLEPCLLLGCCIKKDSVCEFEKFFDVMGASLEKDLPLLPPRLPRRDSDTLPTLPPRSPRASSTSSSSSSTRLSDAGSSGFFRPPLPAKPSLTEIKEVESSPMPVKPTIPQNENPGTPPVPAKPSVDEVENRGGYSPKSVNSF